MSNRNSKLDSILDAIQDINEQIWNDCEVEERDDGSALIYGPFPSFLILVEEIGQPRALVHVNADAANLAFLFMELAKRTGDSTPVIDGAFAVDETSGAILQGPEAYAKKEVNILKFADEILARRLASRHEKPEIIVPKKKIVLAS